MNITSPIMPVGRNGGRIWQASVVISVASSVLVATLGIKAFFIPFLIVISFLLLRYSAILMALYLFSVPVIMLFYLKGYAKISVAMAAFLVGLWLIRKMLDIEEYSVVSSFLIFYPIAFMAVGVISGLHDGVTRAELNTLVRLTIFFAYVYATYDLFQPRSALVIIIGATLPMLYASYSLLKEFAAVRGLVSFLDLYRLKPAGIFPFSNLLGNVLMAIVPFWIALGIWLRKPIYRIVSFALASFLALALIMTNSRAALLGFGVSLIAFFIWAKRIKILIVVTLASILIFASFPLVRNIISLGLRFERGTTSRGLVWSNTIKLYESSPVLGIGPGNFKEAYVPFFETAYQYGFFREVTNAHNFVLNMLTVLGPLGLLLALILYIVPIRESRKALNTARSTFDKAMIYACYSSFLAHIARSMFEGGGIIGSGQLFPDYFFWLPLIMVIKFNKLSRETGGSHFFRNNNTEDQRDFFARLK
jgi:O-antigen ligase